MSKWEGIIRNETKSLCPVCSKIAIVQRKYKQPGKSMGYKVDNLMEKYSMNAIVEYECEACGHVYH